MLGFISFWIDCVARGFSDFWGAFGILDAICVLVAAILQWRQKHHRDTWEKWEGHLKKWALIVLGASMVLSILFLAPYLKYQEVVSAKQKADEGLARLIANPVKAELRSRISDMVAQLNKFTSTPYPANEPMAHYNEFYAHVAEGLETLLRDLNRFREPLDPSFSVHQIQHDFLNNNRDDAIAQIRKIVEHLKRLGERLKE